jgi:hypothetical protein
MKNVPIGLPVTFPQPQVLCPKLIDAQRFATLLSTMKKLKTLRLKSWPIICHWGGYNGEERDQAIRADRHHRYTRRNGHGENRFIGQIIVLALIVTCPSLRTVIFSRDRMRFDICRASLETADRISWKLVRLLGEPVYKQWHDQKPDADWRYGVYDPPEHHTWTASKVGRRSLKVLGCGRSM